MFRRRFCLFLALLLVALINHPGQTQPIPTDRQGDPLPEGAVARLGTTRWQHGGVVTFAAFLPDGKSVVTVSEDRTIRLWAHPSGKEIRRLAEPEGPVAASVLGRFEGVAAMSADGKVLAAWFEGNEIRLFDLVANKELPAVKVDARFPAFSALALSPNGAELACIDLGNAVHIMDRATGKQLREFGGIAGAIFGGDATLVYAPDGKTLAGTALEIDANNFVVGTLKLWDPATGKELRAFGNDKGRSPVSPTFSADSKTFAYSDADGNIRLVETATGKEIGTLPRNGVNPATLRFNKDGSTLYARGMGDWFVTAWDVATKKQAGKFTWTEAPAAGRYRGFANGEMALSPDGKTLLLCNSHHGVQLLDLAGGKEVPGAAGYAGAILALRFSPDGKQVLTQGMEPAPLQWEAATGKLLGPAGMAKATGYDVLSADGRFAVVRLGGPKAGFTVVEIATGKELGTIPGRPPNPFPAVQFSADGKLLAVRWRLDEKLELYEAAGAKLLHTVKLTTGGPKLGKGGLANPSDVMVFSADGRMLATYADPVTVGLWDTATGKRLITLPTEGRSAIASGAFTADGRCLILDMNDGTVTLFELATGQPRRIFGKKVPQPKDNLRLAVGRPLRVGPQEGPSVALSPDGQTLAYAGPDRVVRWWDIDTGKELAAFKGHSGTVNAVAFSPDGKRLASASADTTALIWDLTRVDRTAPAVKALSKEELDGRWKALAGADAAKAFEAMCALTLSPRETVALMKELAKPAPPVDMKHVEQLIEQLQSDQFKVRQKATAELAKIGERIVPAINKALAAQPPLESKQRLEDLREKMTAMILEGERLQIQRAVEVLERIGTKEARELLQALADGAPGAFSATTAQGALARLRETK
jgi:WD40 repeat protein